MTALQGYQLFAISTLFLVAASADEDLSKRDFHEVLCPSEHFRAACEPGEVIFITKAVFGRMQINRCALTDYGHIGCATDVLSTMDARCSGASQCIVKVLDEIFPQNKHCPNDLKSYLEVNYTCLKVVNGARDMCTSGRSELVQRPVGFLASATLDQTGCGGSNSPWVIQTLPGQRINFTLFDFGVNLNSSSQDNQQTRVCRVYATIRETYNGRSLTVCAGDHRIQNVYTSVKDRTEVRILRSQTSDRQTVRFMLQFEVIGCPDPVPPPGGWAKRNSQIAIFGCHNYRPNWTLVCKGTEWVGDRKNCTTVQMIDTTVADEGIVDIMSLPVGVSAVIITLLALVIGCLILSIGLICLKRLRVDNRQTQQETQNILPTDRHVESIYLKQTVVCSLPDCAMTSGSDKPTGPSPGRYDVMELPLVQQQNRSNVVRDTGHRDSGVYPDDSTYEFPCEPKLPCSCTSRIGCHAASYAGLTADQATLDTTESNYGTHSLDDEAPTYKIRGYYDRKHDNGTVVKHNPNMSGVVEGPGLTGTFIQYDGFKN